MKNLAIISDRHLMAVSNIASDVMGIALSCRSIATFNRKLINYQNSDLDGLLIVLSDKVEEDLDELFRETCTLWSVFNKKMVIYSQNNDTYDLLESIINDTQLDCDIVFLEPQKEITELFIKESMIGSFSNDNIYTKEQIEDDTVERVNKRMITTEEQPSDKLLSFMKNLVMEDVSSQLVDASNINNLLDRPQEFVKDDGVLADIDEMIETLTNDRKELDETSQKFIDLETELKILNVLRDNRDIKIKSQLLREYIKSIREEATTNSNIDLEDIEQHRNDVMYLKTKQIELEKQIVSTIEDSKKKILGTNKLFNLSESKLNITLLKESASNLPYRSAVYEAIKVGKESLLNILSLQTDMKDILSELNANLQNVGVTFNDYTKLRDKIDDLHSTHIDKLIRSKQINLVVKTVLESKLYTVCGLVPNCGASLTAYGLASTKRNTLIVDLRLDIATSKTYCSKEPQFSLENWIDKSVDDIVTEIRDCRYNHIQPDLCAVVVDNRKEFFTKILTVLEKVSDLYDRVVVLLDVEKEESNIFLDYAIVNIMVLRPDLSLIPQAKSNLNKLMRYINLKIRYLVYTPVSQQFDEDKALAMLGLSKDIVRTLKVPFMPVDSYKLDFNNIFIEKPVFINNFDI